MLTNKIESEIKDACCNANEAGRKVRKMIDKTVADVQGAAKEVEEAVRHNPVKASLVAGGIGMLIGALLSRRPRG